MTEYKKYYAGENHYQWKVKLAIYQKYDLYKFVLADDEDTIYITSNYVTPATANALEETIDEIMYKSAKYESLTDIYDALQGTFYGQFFYLGEKSERPIKGGINMRNITTNGYKRITKRTAERLYEVGQPVLFCPAKLIPGGPWGNGCTITKKEGTTFTQVLNEFEYYNCNNETGNYTAFYIKE